ncbi:MAG: hypothetical protein ACTSPD_14245 [Promethearchaeota archaeon]
MIIGALIAIVYTLGSIVDLYMSSSLGGAYENGFEIKALTDMLKFDPFDWRLFVVGPLWLIVLLISVIAIWIGYSMLTTPAPIPLEELEEELAAEEAAESS